MNLDQPDFEHLLTLRTGLRRFLNWTEQEAKCAGIRPGQYQLLLAIKGHPDPAGPTTGEVASYLVLRHHSAVGLIDRAIAAGLVTREANPANPSSVRLALTRIGIEKLDELSETHLEEIKHLAPVMRSLRQTLEASELHAGRNQFAGRSCATQHGRQSQIP
jgi:DNA-binding MarR family transcriptional regulator